MGSDQSARTRGTEKQKPRRGRRENVAAFVLFSILEETVIGAVALLVIVLFVPQLALPGATCVAIGLAVFTLVKIHYFLSSAAIPVEDTLVNEVVRVRDDFQPTSPQVWTGRIQVRGESWIAVADEAVPKGSLVQILGREGLRLKVVRVSPTSEHSTIARTEET